MKPVEVNSGNYVDFNKENDKKHPKLEVGDHVRISRYKNIFAKVYGLNCSEEVFRIKKVKNTVPWTYVISDFNGEEIVETLYKSGKQVKESLELKSLRENVINYMLNGKAMIVLLIAVLIETHSINECMFFKTPIFMKKCEI